MSTVVNFASIRIVGFAPSRHRLELVSHQCRSDTALKRRSRTNVASILHHLESVRIGFASISLSRVAISLDSASRSNSFASMPIKFASVLIDSYWFRADGASLCVDSQRCAPNSLRFISISIRSCTDSQRPVTLAHQIHIVSVSTAASSHQKSAAIRIESTQTSHRFASIRVDLHRCLHRLYRRPSLCIGQH